MIVKREEDSNIEMLGQVEKNTVSIDKENVNFITNLLTSNLYSSPLQSFFRETVSNAYDACVEAGSDKPIIMLIREKSNPSSYSRDTTSDISIRDYGTGISPERFEEIYTKIGSSTKRESNNYIGGWGNLLFSVPMPS